MAWALFANGLDEEALVTSKTALLAATEEDKAKYAGYVTRLEAAVEALADDEGRKALAALTEQIAELDAEVSARTSWRFEKEADEFLHSTLQGLASAMDKLNRATDEMERGIARYKTE